MATLEVIRPGTLTLVQDAGRLGVASHGLSQGGAADMHAYCWANYLLGNPMGCAQLEITLGQASFKAHADIECALTGAEMQASLDGEPVYTWKTFMMRKGQTLQLGYARSGLRAYLAVQGGIHTPSVLGSRSTVVRNQIGGVEGRPLQTGDKLPIQASLVRFSPRYVPPRFIPDYDKPIELHLLASSQWDYFSPEARNQFFDNHYHVKPESDRMGCRLEGNAILGGPSGIVSEGIALGAVQIPPNGQPIVLLNDRQTLGGYPKLGCVARIDLPRLAQARPGKDIRFIRGDLVSLRKAWQRFSHFFGLPY
ncbi:biotin-dependent carboxyltransferase family protein [Photobacterium sp. Hal280]|uniref:5-oxoprolinase subunit C family protein n=1 Tax=Photobacterium sp. Hal280 TaxID=3035163 RepID=UPI00301DA198